MADLAGSKVAHFGFTGLISSDNVTKICAALNHAVNNSFDSVYLCFSSLGGYVADGIYLYNHIRALPIPVTMHNTGSVSSIAVAGFVSAERRYCSPHAMFMIHPTALPMQENMTSTRAQAVLNGALADDDRTETILRERASIPDDILAGRRTRDIFIAPDQAFAYGLVHGVSEFTLPRGNQIIQI
jgi:ATP-dependent Clp protease, protease subunit